MVTSHKKVIDNLIMVTSQCSRYFISINACCHEGVEAVAKL